MIGEREREQRKKYIGLIEEIIEERCKNIRCNDEQKQILKETLKEYKEILKPGVEKD